MQILIKNAILLLKYVKSAQTKAYFVQKVCFYYNLVVSLYQQIKTITN